MERSSSQYCGDDGVEFSLPEGVDLVGLDNTSTLRKPQSSYHHHQGSGGGPGSGGGHCSGGGGSGGAAGNASRTAHRKRKPASWQSAIKLIFINIFVCALVLGYALIGSFVFLALEGQSKSPGSVIQVSASGYPVRKANLSLALWNSLQGDDFQQLKNDTVKHIWDITLSMNILYQDNWTRLTADEIGSFQRILVEKILHIVESSTAQDLPYSWTFPRAFLFALTTLTTIGYGGIGPKTSSAKIATMIYAIFGIPIMLWYLSNVGSLLAKIARWLCGKICCCCCYESLSDKSNSSSSSSSSTSNHNRHKISDPCYGNYVLKSTPMDGTLGRGGRDEDMRNYEGHQMTDYDSSEPYNNHNKPRISILFILILSVAFLLGYICFGSWIVSRWERWKFLDSFYFCFLTLTTISFGDIRTQKTGGLERLSQRTEWFCSFYILFGMALTSMFFNILHEEISRRYKRWKRAPLHSNIGGDTLLSPHHQHHHHQGENNKEILATVNRGTIKRRPTIENSYSSSVHFMNYNSPSNTTGSRNFTEETVLSNEIGHPNKPRGLPGSESNQKLYDDEDQIPGDRDYVVSHPIPPPREIYGSHPVFPR